MEDLIKDFISFNFKLALDDYTHSYQHVATSRFMLRDITGYHLSIGGVQNRVVKVFGCNFEITKGVRISDLCTNYINEEIIKLRDYAYTHLCTCFRCELGDRKWLVYDIKTNEVVGRASVCNEIKKLLGYDVSSRVTSDLYTTWYDAATLEISEEIMGSLNYN